MFQTTYNSAHVITSSGHMIPRSVTSVPYVLYHIMLYYIMLYYVISSHHIIANYIMTHYIIT